MKKIFFAFITTAVVIFASCNNKPAEQTEATSADTTVVASTVDTTASATVTDTTAAK